MNTALSAAADRPCGVDQTLTTAAASSSRGADGADLPVVRLGVQPGPETAFVARLQGPSWREIMPVPRDVRLDAGSGLACPMCHHGLIPGVDGWACVARSCWATWDLWGCHGRWEPLPPTTAATSDEVDGRALGGPDPGTADDTDDACAPVRAVDGVARLGWWLRAAVAAALGRGRCARRTKPCRTPTRTPDGRIRLPVREAAHG